MILQPRDFLLCKLQLSLQIRGCVDALRRCRHIELDGSGNASFVRRVIVIRYDRDEGVPFPLAGGFDVVVGVPVDHRTAADEVRTRDAVLRSRCK